MTYTDQPALFAQSDRSVFFFPVQLNFNESNFDGSFTMADSQNNTRILHRRDISILIIPLFYKSLKMHP